MQIRPQVFGLALAGLVASVLVVVGPGRDTPRAGTDGLPSPGAAAAAEDVVAHAPNSGDVSGEAAGPLRPDPDADAVQPRVRYPLSVAQRRDAAAPWGIAAGPVRAEAVRARGGERDHRQRRAAAQAYARSRFATPPQGLPGDFDSPVDPDAADAPLWEFGVEAFAAKPPRVRSLRQIRPPTPGTQQWNAYHEVESRE